MPTCLTDRPPARLTVTYDFTAGGLALVSIAEQPNGTRVSIETGQGIFPIISRSGPLVDILNSTVR